MFSSLSRFRVDGRRLFKYASCKVRIFCKNRAKNLRFQKYSGTCEWGLRSYEHLRKRLFSNKWIIICDCIFSASVLRKLSTGTEKRRLRTLLFRKYWRDVRWVNLRLHDTVARFRAEVEFLRRYNNLGELAPLWLVPLWHFLLRLFRRIKNLNIRKSSV